MLKEYISVKTTSNVTKILLISVNMMRSFKANPKYEYMTKRWMLAWLEVEWWFLNV